MKTYAAVQYAPQQISIDHLENGKYIAQISYWFTNREDAKNELARLCETDSVAAFSKYVIGMADVGLNG